MLISYALQTTLFLLSPLFFISEFIPVIQIIYLILYILEIVMNNLQGFIALYEESFTKHLI